MSALASAQIHTAGDLMTSSCAAAVESFDSSLVCGSFFQSCTSGNPYACGRSRNTNNIATATTTQATPGEKKPARHPSSLTIAAVTTSVAPSPIECAALHVP